MGVVIPQEPVAVSSAGKQEEKKGKKVGGGFYDDTDKEGTWVGFVFVSLLSWRQCLCLQKRRKMCTRLYQAVMSLGKRRNLDPRQKSQVGTRFWN